MSVEITHIRRIKIMPNYNKIVREPAKIVINDPIEVVGESIKSNPTVDHQSEAPLMATVISPSHLNIRNEPDIQGAILGTVADGDTVVVFNSGEEWTHVRTSSGIDGYAMSQYIGPSWYE
jgi:uncharacterized protein YgiM (DUF1202 family)